MSLQLICTRDVNTSITTMLELRPVLVCFILATLIAIPVLSALGDLGGCAFSPSRWIGNYQAVSQILVMAARNETGSTGGTGQHSRTDISQTLPPNQTLVKTVSKSSGSAEGMGQHSPSDMSQSLTLQVNHTVIAGANNTTVRTVNWDQNSPAHAGQIFSIQQKIGLNLRATKRKRCLKFIHIPKTAGTKIESMGEWGRGDGNLTCLGKQRCHQFRHRQCCFPTHTKDVNCSVWHTPPTDDPLLAKSYSRCNTFCVVRHPISRWISEYQWHILYWSTRRGRDPCSPQVLAEYSEDVMNYSFPSVDYRADCHRVPQSKYVVSNDGQRLLCNHVIRFENLTAEFNALMKAYKLPQRMDRNKSNSVGTDCTIHISETLKKWIYTNYQSDFQLFGYSV
eukprot:Skav204021  [mRNA]  locus=scaffold229:36511:37692:+ [translate_table: standard]